MPEDAKELISLFESLSRESQIMVITYLTALRDKEVISKEENKG